MTKSKIVSIILAGGTGERIGADCPKQYIEVHGESILHHTLKALLPHVDVAVVVCQEEWQDYVNHNFSSDKEILFAPAGDTGFDSLRNGIAALEAMSTDTLVMIHDAVRPLVTAEVIIDNIRVARQLGNAITAVETYETLLLAPDGLTVCSMTRRESMFRAQTPQSFSLGVLRRMIEEARDRCIIAQSACTLAQQLGYELHLSHGDFRNFKITTPSDLDLYETLIS